MLPAFIHPALRHRYLPVLGMVMLVGCEISVNPRSPVTEDEIHDPGDISATSQQIRLRMRSLVDPFTGEIESAADRIIAASDDPAVERAALEWKAEAIPAIREALFQPAPITALFDTWVLTNQMALFFSSGPGANELGPHAHTAVSTSMKLEREIRDVARSFTRSGDVDSARTAAREWAAAHPITTGIAHRESTLSRSLKVDAWNDFNASESLGSVSMSVDDLNRKLEVYTDQLFRQARWEGQLLSMDLADQFQLDEAMPLAAGAAKSIDELSTSVREITSSVEGAAGSIDELVPLVERLIIVTEGVPALITKERMEMISSASKEVSRALQFVSSERLAALQSIHDTIAAEREIMARDVERISTKAIDHAFWRATQLVAGVVVVLLLAGLIALKMLQGTLVRLLKANPPAPVS